MSNEHNNAPAVPQGEPVVPPILDWAVRTLREIADQGRSKLGDDYPTIVSIISALKAQIDVLTDKAPAAPSQEPAVPKIDYHPGTWYEVKTHEELEAFFLSRLPSIREAAREHGYAIGMHGSLRRDMDLIAVPWRNGASEKDKLAHAIAMASVGITRNGGHQWETKPCGRVATSLPCCWTPWPDVAGSGHIDLSVMEVKTSEPFGYFRPEPFGWTDCAADDEGAVALYEAPPDVASLQKELGSANDFIKSLADVCQKYEELLGYRATPPQEPSQEPVTGCIACAMRDKAIGNAPDQTVAPEYIEWLKTKSRSAGVAGNEAWNAGVAWATSQEPVTLNLAEPFGYVGPSMIGRPPRHTSQTFLGHFDRPTDKDEPVFTLNQIRWACTMAGIRIAALRGKEKP